MTITDDTKLVEINDEAGIIEALEVLGGSALLANNRRLYEHIYAAKVRAIRLASGSTGPGQRQLGDTQPRSGHA